MTTAAYAMNIFTSKALNGFSPFQLVFVSDPPDLTSLSFPKIDTLPVVYREYYNLLLARAQMVGRLLLEWRTHDMIHLTILDHTHLVHTHWLVLCICMIVRYVNRDFYTHN